MIGGYVTIENLLTFYGLNLVSAIVFIVFVYNRYRKNDTVFVFTFFMFNTIVFFVAYMLSAVDVSFGFAFGLFAIFGILRYRTEQVAIKEMTYLFGTITIGLINGLAASMDPSLSVLIPNILIVGLAFILEVILDRPDAYRDIKEPILSSKMIIYNNTDNIRPEKQDELITDLVSITGLDIIDIRIGRIDLLTNSVRIRVFYKSDEEKK
ncbi:MAG TPA: DUF4956 domain-containing protein [Candidatus Marinimicrobia bacterium]|nr:DUF4956 domain-containing protein [Candidatus Neomarinimicrobiota bacterium]